ncbi:hypothetical protein ABZP36_025843, partial [Zizania latifolia]
MSWRLMNRIRLGSESPSSRLSGSAPGRVAVWRARLAGRTEDLDWIALLFLLARGGTAVGIRSSSRGGVLGSFAE